MTLLPLNPNAFARSPLDRAAHHRRDEEWLKAARAAANTRFMPISRGRPLVFKNGAAIEAAWLGPPALALFPQSAATLFLGLGTDGAAHFAIDAGEGEALQAVGRFEELRPLAALLERDDIAMIGCAKAIFEWHGRHGFCANCGGPSRIVEAGWKRECPACKAEHFPRVDPVCIMLPTHGGHCLLGRQAAWPRGMHSALAGFIEPGETIEEAVARETLEEAGLRVREVRLHSSQPWPFPHSLMLGAICDVVNMDEKVDTTELESARWFSRDEARLLLAGKLPGAFCPPPFAIAHQLLKTWAEG